MCVHNPFCSQTGDVLLCFFAVENFKSPQRQPRDSEKHLLTEVDLLFTDLLSHRLYSWWEWLPRAVILIQNHYYFEDRVCVGVLSCVLCMNGFYLKQSHTATGLTLDFRYRLNVYPINLFFPHVTTLLTQDNTCKILVFSYILAYFAYT